MNQNFLCFQLDDTTVSFEKSLQQLKQLEQLIESKHFGCQLNGKSKKEKYAHEPANTELFEPNLKKNHSFGPCKTPRLFNEKVEKVQPPLHNPRASTYTQFHDEHHNNQTQSIIKQNRRLKKYANCLLKMHEFLKNQLIKRDIKQEQGVVNQIDELKKKYLKQLKRGKQLQQKKMLLISSKRNIVKNCKTKMKPQLQQHVALENYNNKVPIKSNRRTFSYRNAQSTIDYSSKRTERNINICQVSEQSSTKIKRQKKVDIKQQNTHKKFDRKRNIYLLKQTIKCQKLRNHEENHAKRRNSLSKNNISCKLCYN